MLGRDCHVGLRPPRNDSIHIMIMTKSMFLFYFSITLAIASSALYHLVAKSTPSNVNFTVSLLVTYAVAFVVTLFGFFFFPAKNGIMAESQTTKLGKHRACHRHRRHRIRIPAHLSLRLESGDRRGTGQCGGIADSGPCGDFCFQR